MRIMWGLPCWPVGPMVCGQAFLILLQIAAVVFTIIMLIDCLKRPPSGFAHPLTKKAEHDKLIWAGAMLLSLGFYCVGAIVYLFVVKTAKPNAGT
jgi:hypothetical protein